MRVRHVWILVLGGASLFQCSSPTGTDALDGGGSGDATTRSEGAAIDAGEVVAQGPDALAQAHDTSTPSPDVVPGSCPSLPPAGTWQAMNPVGITDTFALVVDPFDAATLWMGTCLGSLCNVPQTGGIYKSTDCGTTWTRVNVGENATNVEQGAQTSMAVDPVEPGVIYLSQIYGVGGLWKSTNGGVDWQQLFAPGSAVASSIQSVDSISMDANDHLHLVVGSHDNVTPNWQAFTTDGGSTWTPVMGPVGFQEGGGPWVLSATSWLYGGVHLWLTTDNGSSFENLDPDPAMFWGFSGGEVETHPIVQGPDGAYYLTSNQGVGRSTDGGHTWNAIATAGGQMVGLIAAGGRLFTSDQWTTNIYTASFTDPTSWSQLPPPPNFASQQGCPYIDYDPVHQVLYLSCFNSGAWRFIMP